MRTPSSAEEPTALGSVVSGDMVYVRVNNALFPWSDGGDSRFTWDEVVDRSYGDVVVLDGGGNW